MNEESKDVEASAEPQKRGCLFWGCLGSTFLVLLAFGLVGYFVWVMRGELLVYTSDQPAKIQSYQLKEGEYAALEKRLADAAEAPAAGAPAKQLELTPDDLNAFLAGSPELRRYSKRAHFRIEGDKVFLDTSIPLEGSVIQALKLDGRHFNGTYGLRLELKDGKPSGRVENITADGKPIPEKYMALFRQEDIVAIIFADHKDNKFAEALKNLKSLEVKDGKVIATR